MRVMKKVRLKWAKSIDEKSFNFGDDLSPYLINKISGLSIDYISFADSRPKVIRHFLSVIYRKNFSILVLKDFIKSMIIKDYVISIGSILQWHSSARCIVWGSGIINRKDKINQSKFLAVRGHYTKALIVEQGMNCPDVFGDPALLTPLVYSPKSKKKYKLGIIPHVTHFDSISSNLSLEKILIINLNSQNIEEVIEQISMCEYTISSSLHGLILSHAYSIKSLWFKYELIPLLGDNVKFLDYFSSVNIPEYAPFSLILDNTINTNELVNLINNNCDINSIKIDLKKLQQLLLRAAPFPVKAEFLN
jgi:hypothetical protein